MAQQGRTVVRRDSQAGSAPVDSGQAQRAAAARDRAGKVLDATDQALDEIDAVLQPNAAEFVRSYVQRGGE